MGDESLNIVRPAGDTIWHRYKKLPPPGGYGSVICGHTIGYEQPRSDGVLCPTCEGKAEQHTALPPCSAPTVSFRDDRGDIINVITGTWAARHIALITSARGAIRGNHYHPTVGGRQYVYVLDGLLEVTLRQLDPKGPSTYKPRSGPILTEAGPLTLVRLEPYTAHAFRALEATRFLAIDEYPATPDVYEQVTIPYKLID